MSWDLWDQDCHIQDNNTINSTGYYFDLHASGVTQLQKCHVASANVNHSYEVTIRDSVNLIYPEGGGMGTHMVTLAFDTLISFTRYDPGLPANSAWCMDDTWGTGP